MKHAGTGESAKLTILVRKIFRSALFIVMLAVTFVSVQARSFFDFPGSSGSFLAGQFALEGLNTSLASSSLMEAAQAQWDNPEVVGRGFAALVADGRVDESLPVARHLLELEPDNILAKLVIATAALKERRYASVVTTLRGLGLSDFVDIAATIIQAWARVGQNDLNRAFAEMDDMSNGSIDGFLVFHKALMADLAGSPAAVDLARSAYENDPFLGRIVEFYVRVLANSGRRDQALDILDKFSAEGLVHPTVDRVRAIIEAGQVPGKYAGSINAGAAELFQGIGVALGRDGSGDIALIFLRLGLYLDPSADATSLTVAQLFESAERYDAANQIYRSIQKDSPFHGEALVRTAENFDAMGDRPEAIRRLRNLVTIDPTNLVAITSLGNMLRLDEQFSEAAKVYTRAVKLVGGEHPRDWRYYYLRGIAYERSDLWDLAETDFLKALDLNPNQPQVLNYLGYSWVDKGIHLQRALGMIEQAVRSNPQDGYIVDSLGWAMFRLNQFDDAVRILERAVQLNPNDPEINDHLGDAYWRVGRKTEARFQWNIASSVDEVGIVVQRVIPKLENGLPELQDIQDAA